MEKRNVGVYEYTMSKELAKTILGDRKGDEKKMDQQPFLCQWVNNICGLKGTCIGVKLA